MIEKFTFSESSLPDDSNDTNFSSLGLLWAKQSTVKGEKNNPRVVCQFLAL
jgi:hypothetical protein